MKDEKVCTVLSKCDMQILDNRIKICLFHVERYPVKFDLPYRYCIWNSVILCRAYAMITTLFVSLTNWILSLVEQQYLFRWLFGIYLWISVNTDLYPVNRKLFFALISIPPKKHLLEQIRGACSMTISIWVCSGD
jgi:hypothetical protein